MYILQIWTHDEIDMGVSRGTVFIFIAGLYQILHFWTSPQPRNSFWRRRWPGPNLEKRLVDPYQDLSLQSIATLSCTFFVL